MISTAAMCKLERYKRYNQAIGLLLIVDFSAKVALQIADRLMRKERQPKRQKIQRYNTN